MAHVSYAPELSLRAGREEYFTRAGFDESSYTDRWVHLRAGPLRFGFPNTAARIRAVRLHDLHHVLTEYDTSWTGEAEIGAWEIASGCRDHYAAWVLNVGAMAIGLAIAPARIYRAFVRGRHSRNLYATAFSEQLLERSVGTTRKELALDRRSSPARIADIAAFAVWSSASAAIGLLPLYALAAALLPG
jgi:hypothetical protein